MCGDEKIKEALPGYLDGSVDQKMRLAIDNHLGSCQDCRNELSLLRLMSEETVPDPGEAFWNALPGRVYRAVEQEKKKRFDLSWITERIAMPRWTFAAVTAGFVLVVSLLTVQSFWKPRTESVPSEYLISAGALADPINIGEIDAEQADMVNSWAGEELASIAQSVAPIVADNADTDISDEIADLNIKEAEQFSDMLKEWKQEG